MSGELLDIKQVMARLRVSERTIFNLIKRGQLMGFKAGREWRFTENDIRNFEEQQRHSAALELRSRSKQTSEEVSRPLVCSMA